MAAKVEIDIFANDRTGGVLGNISRGLGGILQTAAGFVTGQLFMQAGQAIANFATGSITQASNLNETLTKTDAIFGAYSESMKKWAESAATSVGLSKGAALDAASSFALFGASAGLAGQDLNDFATENVQLAADMASFFNTTVEDASTAIAAAFRGETEPIRRYNVMLDDASLRQKALELGIVSTTKNALTPQQKVLAAQALIMEQTSKAQGDFERTSGGLANQQRILAAQFQNAQMQLGEAFLPLVTKAMTFINTVGIPALTGFIDAFKNWGFLNDVILPMLDNIITKMGAFTSISLEGTPLGNLFVFLRSWWSTYGPGLTTSFNLMRDAFINALSAMATAMASFIDNNLNRLVIWLDDNGPRIEGFFSKLADFFANYVAPTLSNTWAYIIAIIDNAITIILGYIEIFLSIVDGDWANAWKTFKEIAQTNMQGMQEIIKAYLNIIAGLFKTNIEDVLSTLRGYVTQFYDIGRNMIDGLINGIMSGKSPVETLLGIGNQITNAMRNMFDIRSPSGVFEDFGKNMMQGLANGIGDGARIPVNVMGNVMGGMVPSTPGMAGAMAGGGITINVNAQNSMIDERWFATQFKPGVIQIMRDAGVRFG